MKKIHILKAIALSAMGAATVCTIGFTNPAAASGDAVHSSADKASTSCYFRDAEGRTTWELGLNADNTTYRFKGDWVVTPQTKVEKFETTELYHNLYDSCIRAQTYHNARGALVAIFAAANSLSLDYPIVLNGEELFPLF
jgi:hypothetical protein